MESKFEYNKTLLPIDIKEAIDILEIFFKRLKPRALEMNEEEFVNATLLSLGFFLKDVWQLGWFNNAQTFLDFEKQPKLQSQFMRLGIYEPLTMSEILIIMLYKKYNNLAINITQLLDKFR